MGELAIVGKSSLLLNESTVALAFFSSPILLPDAGTYVCPSNIVYESIARMSVADGKRLRLENIT